MTDIFKVIELKTAKEVLDYLRPSADHWGILTRWIFRGQVDAEWKLIPRVWRENPLITKSIPHDHGGQFLSQPSEIFEKIKTLSDDHKDNLYRLSLYAKLEIEHVREFINLADKLGLHAPHFSDLQGIVIDDLQANYIKNFFNRENRDLWLNGAIGLAQHHGIPTRLLDWSYSPYVAGYFSTCGNDDNINCAIYAMEISKPYIDRYSQPPVTEGFIHLVHVQTTENNFLFRQQALFTYDDSGDNYYQNNGQYPDMEDTLARIAKVYHRNYCDNYRKIIFPASEKEEFQRLLKKEGYYKASLMATYDNIADEVNQQRKEAEDKAKKLFGLT